jgi:hypothetical protein
MLALSDTINKAKINKLIAVILQWRPKRGCAAVGPHKPVQQAALLPRAPDLDANTIRFILF